MTSLRNLALHLLLVLFIVGAVIDQHPGRMERVHPPAEHHWSRPATPQEAKAAELHRQLDQWRAQLEQQSP